MHLLMFDIDGTLVDSTGFDSQLYADAVREVLGIELDGRWGRYEHVTDSGILAQVLRELGADRDVAELEGRVRRRFIRLVEDYVARVGSDVREIAGARRLVERLLTLPGVRVAVATGGWRETAALKLRAIGLSPERLSLATSSDAMARTEIMRIAARRALPDGTFRRATYFGDGPWDRHASTELGYEFVAIGRGVEHSVRYDDFRDMDAILVRLELMQSPGVS